MSRSVVACLLLLPSAAWAQPRIEEAPVAYAPAGPRLRFGVAGTVSGGGLLRTDDPRLQGNVWSVGIGASLDLGVQFGDRLAVYAHGLASMGPLTFLSGLAGVVEYTPTPTLSLGAGIGWAGIATVNPLGDVDSATRAWQGLSIPLIIGLNLGGGRQPTGRVSAFRMSLEGGAVFVPGTSDLAFYNSLNIGYVSM